MSKKQEGAPTPKGINPDDYVPGHSEQIKDQVRGSQAGVKDKLDRLAAAFIQEFNNIHQQGFGIDGTTGNNFFLFKNSKFWPDSELHNSSISLRIWRDSPIHFPHWISFS